MPRNRTPRCVKAYTNEDLQSSVVGVGNNKKVFSQVPKEKFILKTTLRKHLIISFAHKLWSKYFDLSAGDKVLNFLMKVNELGEILTWGTVKERVYEYLKLSDMIVTKMPYNWAKQKKVGNDWLIAFRKQNPELKILSNCNFVFNIAHPPVVCCSSS